MRKIPDSRNKRRSSTEMARIKRLRRVFQRAKPSLQELVDSGRYSQPVSQGDLLPMLQLATAIRSARKELKLSLADLARRTGIDKAALSRIENGQNTNPTISTLDTIAHSLGSRLKVVLEQVPQHTSAH